VIISSHYTNRAFLVAPNVLFNKTWGKFLFAGCDLLIGYLLYKILDLLPVPISSGKTNDNKRKKTTSLQEGKGTTFSLRQSLSKDGYNLLLTCVWLFNPFGIVVSTRGNAESVIGVLVLASIYLIFTNQLFWGSVVYVLATVAFKGSLSTSSLCSYGLAVHFKIYPIIYSLPILFYLSSHQKRYHPLSLTCEG